MSPRSFEKISKWMPNPTLGAWLQLLPLAVMFGVLWFTAFFIFELKLTTVKFWEYLVYGWLYAATGYWVGLSFCVKFLRARWLASVFACIYLFLYGVNAAFAHESGAVLQPYYLWILSLDNWTYYLTKPVFIMMAVFALNCALATCLIYWQTKAIKQLHIRGVVILLICLFFAPLLRQAGFFNPTKVIAATFSVHNKGIWQTDQTFQLQSLADNPVMILSKALMQLPKTLILKPVTALASMSNTLKAWHLPLGPRKYPPLGLKPFNHIVVFATESLSLDFLAPYNTNLPPDLTPFYGSPAVKQAMFVNYKTVALPTQPGLSVTYNSHPNANGLLASGNELSMIKILDAQGYETYFLMSSPESFNNDEDVFKKMGFEHVIGVETWQTDPHKQPFVEGWGLMDRVLYQTALDLLKQNWNKKIYIHVAGADTHGPYMRDYYGSLQYPDLPADVAHLASNSYAQNILDDIFRHDFDIGSTIKEMRKQNLLGDDTLVVLTADHNFPHSEVLNNIPGYPASYYTRIPLEFFSGQPLPKANLKQLHSQLDFAPTMMHLLGLPIPEDWWGESIFAPNQNAPRVAQLGRNLVVETEKGRRIVSLDHPQGTDEKGLVSLFNCTFTNSPTASTVITN